ncbi:MAG: hypothetical protein U0L20_08125 [Ruminococcus sp.]|nr:hypothetical protein [Ruminococcus sp.]
MNIANVTSRFALISGLDNSEVYKWRCVISDACDYIKSVTVKKSLSESDEKRRELLSAVYAYKMYALCNVQKITSFVAGDVHITSPDSELLKAEAMWRQYSKDYADLFEDKGFYFGRVVI